MKYKQYAVKFTTLQEFVTNERGEIIRFVFREPQKIVIKKCDGFWFINRTDFTLSFEWGNTWNECLNTYRLGILNAYYIFCLDDEDIEVYYRKAKENFYKEILVYNEDGKVKSLF